MENNPFCLNVVSRQVGSVPTYFVADDMNAESFLNVHHFIDFIPIYGIDALKTMHTHDFYVIVCMYEGEGTHVIDFMDYDFQKGGVFFLSPGQMHTMKDVSSVKGYILSFSQAMMDLLHDRIRGSLLQDVFHRFGSASLCTLDDQAKQQLDVIFKQLMEEAKKGKKAYAHADYLASLLTMLLLNLQRYGVWEERQCTENSSSEFQVYKMFSECVEKNYKRLHSVKEYAEMMNVSASSLNKCTRQIVNLPPSRLINNRIIMEAKHLLAFTSMRIKDVAIGLGYEDASNFNKFFRRVTGISPADFRDLHHVDD